MKLADASVDTVVIAAVLLHNPKRGHARGGARSAPRAPARRSPDRAQRPAELEDARRVAEPPLRARAGRCSGHGDRNGPVRTWSRSRGATRSSPTSTTCGSSPMGHARAPEAHPRRARPHEPAVPQPACTIRCSAGRERRLPQRLARPLVLQRVRQCDTLTLVRWRRSRRMMAGAAANMPEEHREEHGLRLGAEQWVVVEPQQDDDDHDEGGAHAEVEHPASCFTVRSTRDDPDAERDERGEEREEARRCRTRPGSARSVLCTLTPPAPSGKKSGFTSLAPVSAQRGVQARSEPICERRVVPSDPGERVLGEEAEARVGEDQTVDGGAVAEACRARAGSSVGGTPPRRDRPRA